HPLFHLAGRLVGERHGDDLRRIDPPLVGEPGDPVGDYAGFPRSGPREHQLRTLAMGDRGDLLRVQLLLEVQRASAHRTGKFRGTTGGWQATMPPQCSTPNLSRAIRVSRI